MFANIFANVRFSSFSYPSHIESMVLGGRGHDKSSNNDSFSELFLRWIFEHLFYRFYVDFGCFCESFLRSFNRCLFGRLFDGPWHPKAVPRGGVHLPRVPRVRTPPPLSPTAPDSPLYSVLPVHCMTVAETALYDCG